MVSKGDYHKAPLSDLERIDRAAITLIDQAMAEAINIKNEYYEFREQANTKYKWKNKSVLTLSVGQGKDGYPRFNWRWVKFTRAANQRGYIRLVNYIKRGGGYCYNLLDLKARAQDWEYERVVRIERALALLREHMDEIGDLRHLVKRIRRRRADLLEAYDKFF